MKRIEIFSSLFCRGVVLPFAVLAVSLICIACERDNTREIRPPVTEAVWVTMSDCQAMRSWRPWGIPSKSADTDSAKRTSSG